MLFFYMTGFFEYYLKDNICAQGGGQMSLPFTLPRPLLIATPTRILAWFLGNFPSIDRELTFSGVPKMGRGLCGRGLVGVTFVGVAQARFARYGHAHKGHAHKSLVHLEPQKANSWSINGLVKKDIVWSVFLLDFYELTSIEIMSNLLKLIRGTLYMTLHVLKMRKYVRLLYFENRRYHLFY